MMSYRQVGQVNTVTEPAHRTVGLCAGTNAPSVNPPVTPTSGVGVNLVLRVVRAPEKMVQVSVRDQDVPISKNNTQIFLRLCLKLSFKNKGKKEMVLVLDV